MKNKTGFTLIELLIVVAIIAILAAIAIPNFLQAQTRAKVSRAEADLRTLALAMEIYYVDHNAFPPTYDVAANDYVPNDARLSPLTTPVAYLTSIPLDHFKLNRHFPTPGYEDVTKYPHFSYWLWDRDIVDRQRYHDVFGGPLTWQITSTGPDGIVAWHHTPTRWETIDGVGRVTMTHDTVYDPTNGTISWGDIWRVGGVW